jgi:hypothetical protein
MTEGDVFAQNVNHVIGGAYRHYCLLLLFLCCENLWNSTSRT